MSPAAARQPRGITTTVVGLLGELLITLGVLLGLFVVWQLWWTDVQSARTQTALLDSLDWATPLPALPAAEEVPEPRYDDPPVLAEPEVGTTFATLLVPRWGADYEQPITQGVDRPSVLDPLGIGHYPGTAMPGDVGNFAVAAHRTTYGKPFHRVAELEVGDPLVVRTEEAWYVYRVTEWHIVLPHRVDVIAPVPGAPDAPPSGRFITLTTCHPMYSAAERYIVHGELEYWMPTDEGAPAALRGG